MDAEVHAKMQRRKTILIEKQEKMQTEASIQLENLKTAVDAKMEVAVVGVLTTMVQAIEKSNEKVKAMNKAEVAPIIVNIMEEMMGYSSVCERCLQFIAVLCRNNDESKSSLSLESSKDFGVAGASSKIAAVMQKYSNDPKIMEAGCDAIRGLCYLESNRRRLGDDGVCEILGRSLPRWNSNPDVSSWLCRAIGHLTNDNDENREKFATIGAIVYIIELLQYNQTSATVLTEICWAIRNVSQSEENRERLQKSAGVDNVLAVFKYHITSAVFTTEACRALVAMISSEDDELIVKMVSGGLIPLVMKALKKNPDSEELGAAAFNLLYFVACEVRFCPKLVSADILDTLSITLEAHASEIGVAEWCCRTVNKIAQLEGMVSKMRGAGLCETIVSAVQRQAISTKVCGWGCLAIGDLAMDKNNHSRLTGAGAPEVVVAALRRHDDSVDVVEQSCYALHYLAMTQNNVGWMGANGGCEAVNSALAKHMKENPSVTRNACRAVGSLAYKDEGNLQRFRLSGACANIVIALRTHAVDALVAEYACRAVYWLTADNGNVTEFAKTNVCKLVVAVLQAHAEESGVVSQACLAISGLAVKSKTDKVHRKNTDKLVKNNAIENIVVALRKYPKSASVQRAGAMAIASLARLDDNRERLGQAGACELLVASLQTHGGEENVTEKLALAIDALSQNNEVNLRKFASSGVTEMLLNAVHKHERHEGVAYGVLRALVVLQIDETVKPRVKNETAIKVYLRAMKVHEKEEKVARWGCNLIYCCATDDRTRALLGISKACDLVVNALTRHGALSSDVASFGCMAISSLSMYEPNCTRFNNTETCMGVVHAVKAHTDEEVVCEWGCAAIYTLASHAANRTKLGSAGACPAVATALSKQMTNEMVCQIAVGAIYELCQEPSNRALMGAAGGCEVITATLEAHASNSDISSQICKSVASVANGNVENGNKFGESGICNLLKTVLEAHAFHLSLVEWVCASIANLADKNSQNQKLMKETGLCNLIVTQLENHNQNAPVCFQGVKAIRTMTTGSKDNSQAFSDNGAIPVTVKVLMRHKDTVSIVENGCWILGNIVAPESSSIDKNSIEIYAVQAYWDLLTVLLELHSSQEQATRWMCAAVSVFADHGKLSHANICDVLMKLLGLYPDRNIIVQRCLFTIGSLAECHPENRQRLSKNNACEAVDAFFTLRSEGEAMCQATFRAIAGLAANDKVNQDKFNSFPSLCKLLVKALYNELESEEVSRWGCAAISALASKHPSNQIKLGFAGNYIADIIDAHKASVIITKEALKAISALSHGSSKNRNVLGAADACESLSKIFTTYTDNDEIIILAIKATANLSANNPHNQSRLGNAGVCETLVQAVIARKSNKGREKLIIKWFCWAVGNIVQIVKSLAVAESSGKIKNANRLLQSGVAEVLMHITKYYKDDPVIVQWASRAIHNLCKSRQLKAKFINLKAPDILPKFMEAYAKDKDITYWVKLAIDTLDAPAETSSPDARNVDTPPPSVPQKRPSKTATNTNANANNFSTPNAGVGASASSSLAGAYGSPIVQTVNNNTDAVL